MINGSRDIKMSIVVTARNDNHGGGFIHRMQIFVNGLLAQCERHKLMAELIIVEWNPPVEKPRLSQALIWPDNSGFCTVRIIEVPPAIHNQYKYAHKLPLYQMIAKNVGMRRARGRFILATNIDVLFSDELMHFLAKAELREGVLYRIDRTDVPEDVPLQATIDEQLNYCLENIIRINCREGTLQKLTGRYYPSYGQIDVVLTNLHFNACGDFTLMSTADWHRLNGYPEFDMYSPHLDSLMLIISYYAGIRQEILREPMRLYHLEHGGAWIAENASKLEQEKKTEKIPVLKLSQFEGWTSDMNAKGKPIIFNDSKWGFAFEDLKDTVVIAADWETAEEAGNLNILSQGDSDKREKDNTEKSILIIAENIPEFDSDPHDRLYLMIKALAETHKVTFVARRGAEKGKYVEHLRRLGVIVFYDVDGLMEHASSGVSVNSQYASTVSVKTLLDHQAFNVILLGSTEISSFYLSVIRESSPRSILIINAAGSNLTGGHDPDKSYLYDEADMVFASPDSAEDFQKEFPELNIRILPETTNLTKFEEELRLIIDKLPQPANRNVERFRLFPDSLPDAMLSMKKTEVTEIFILNNNSDTSMLSLDTLLKYSDPEFSNVIVALNNKQCGGVDRKLGREARHYFKHDSEYERDKFIAGIIGNCQSKYIAVVEDRVIVTPQWDRRLAAHLNKFPDISIITARRSDFLYESIYELENDAFELYEQYAGNNIPSGKIDVPCLIFRPSLLNKNGCPGPKGILKNLTAGHKTAVALDTLAFHLQKGLKEKAPVVFKRTPDKKISAIVTASDSGEGLLACLNSLFMQKDIDYSDVEIVVVYTGSDKGAIDILSGLKAPCDFKYFIHEGGHSSALNQGIREASGEYILLVSHETVAHEDLISEHLKTHLKYAGKDVAVLGNIVSNSVDDPSPFTKFMSKNPKLPFVSQLVYNYGGIGDPENAGLFYLTNISVKRRVFQKVGMFDGGSQDGWESIEFASRFALNGHRVVYSRKPVVFCSAQINAKTFIDRRISVGRQYAIMTYRHPNIWRLDTAKKECLRHFIGKEKIFERAVEVTRALEDMPEDILNNYRFAGMSLLDKCYCIILNYYFALGINDVIRRIEGEGWLNRYAARNSIDLDDIMNKNLAYELLFESYWHSGRGDHALFSKCIEQSSGLLDAHPSPYYAVGNFYFNQDEYGLAEATFEKGIEKRKRYVDDYIFPAEDESLYIMWLAMACIPLGKYEKAAQALEQLIAERVTLSAEQEAVLYKCLSLSYKALGENRKELACRQESLRIDEAIKARGEVSNMVHAN
ncbi:MAG: glycosyltransferase family 2 protein [Nitrospirae bacterium]|nr:glycosyltransferase family 2 protein [Nitrospirota bacterium]